MLIYLNIFTILFLNTHIVNQTAFIVS